MMFKWGNYNFPFFSLNETIVGNMGTFRKREYPKVCVNQQTDVRQTYQFGGLFYGKEKGYPTKSSPSGNDGQLSEGK